jgi:hypothetical protein
MKKTNHKALHKAGKYVFRIRVTKRNTNTGADDIVTENLKTIIVTALPPSQLLIRWDNPNPVSVNVGEQIKRFIVIECKADNGSSAEFTEDKIKKLKKCLDLKLDVPSSKSWKITLGKEPLIFTNDRSVLQLFYLTIHNKISGVPVSGISNTSITVSFTNKHDGMFSAFNSASHKLKCLLLPGKPLKLSKSNIKHSFDGIVMIPKMPCSLPLGSTELPTIYFQFKDVAGNDAINVLDEKVTLDFSCKAFKEEQDEDVEDDEDEATAHQIAIEPNDNVYGEFNFLNCKASTTQGPYDWSISLMKDHEADSDDSSDSDADDELEYILENVEKGTINIVAPTYEFVAPHGMKWEAPLNDHFKVIVQNRQPVEGLKIMLKTAIGSIPSTVPPPTMYIQPLQCQDQSQQVPLVFNTNTGELEIPPIPGVTDALTNAVYEIVSETSNDAPLLYLQVETLMGAVNCFDFDDGHPKQLHSGEESKLPICLYDSDDKSNGSVEPTEELLNIFLNTLTLTVTSTMGGKKEYSSNQYEYKFELDSNTDQLYFTFKPLFQGFCDTGNSGLPIDIHFYGHNSEKVQNCRCWVLCGIPKYLVLKDEEVKFSGHGFPFGDEIESNELQRRTGEPVLSAFQIQLKDAYGSQEQKTVIKRWRNLLQKV